MQHGYKEENNEHRLDMSKLKRIIGIIVALVLLGIATVNCYHGWMPVSDLEWSMWAGNCILGVIALIYIFRH